MQKAKKMSKQTLVIAVLAVLLVLSLALSVTGAWFTDTDSASHTTKIEFGTVAIAASEDSAIQVKRADGNTTSTLLLPGDKISFAGDVDAKDSTVDIYLVAVFTNLKAYGTTKAYASATAKGDYTVDITNALFASSVITPTLTGVSETGKITDITLGAEDSTVADVTVTAYKVGATDTTRKFTYSATYTIDGATVGNTITAADGKVYKINRGGDETAAGGVLYGVWFEASVEFYAVQADNIDSDGVAAAIDDMYVAAHKAA